MVPVNTCVPVVITKLLLVPEMAPAKVSAALVIVRVLLPNATEPTLLPDKLMIEAPVVVLLISKVALSMMLLEAAIEPVPVKAKVPPLMVVVPV